MRRARRLVVSFHATVANYEYLVYWRFYQDASIECEVRATGIMVTSSFPEGEQPPYGTLVDERTYAPFHQHFIVARLDMDVDGASNTVHMTESEALPTRPTTRTGSRWSSAASRCAPSRRASRTTTGDPALVEGGQRASHQPARHAGRLQARAGRVLPGHDGPGVAVFRRAQVMGHTLWVTPYDAGRALAMRRVRRPERARTAGCRCGRRRTAPSTTPTSCSGTSSASITSRARRTGR